MLEPSINGELLKNQKNQNSSINQINSLDNLRKSSNEAHRQANKAVRKLLSDRGSHSRSEAYKVISSSIDPSLIVRCCLYNRYRLSKHRKGKRKSGIIHRVYCKGPKEILTDDVFNIGMNLLTGRALAYYPIELETIINGNAIYRLAEGHYFRDCQTPLNMEEKMITLPDKQYFRPNEVAKIIEEPIRFIYYWLRREKIKHIHHGRKTMIPREEVERIITEGV